MTMSNQQLNVQLQQFLETLETTLQAARNELVKQVQNATSTTTHEEQIKRADRLFKLRSYLGAMNQQNELEATTTEESSTPRFNKVLSTQMYYILVMMKTLYRCRNASVNEVFARRRQFVREWEPRFVGLLRNVLSCKRKDDVPTQITETVIDDIGKAQESRAVYRCERRTSRSRGHNSTLTAISCQCRSVCSRRARAKASMARMQGRNRLRKRKTTIRESVTAAERQVMRSPRAGRD